MTDSASGDDMEHIPLSMIGDVLSLVGDRASAPFDNLLVYTATMRSRLRRPRCISSSVSTRRFCSYETLFAP